MRPKRRVLVVSMDEAELSVWSYMLAIRGFYVLEASSAEDAIERFRTQRIDVCVVSLVSGGNTASAPALDGNVLVIALKSINAEVPMILIGEKVKPGFPHAADAFLGRGTLPADLVERVKVMAGRKRGPKSTKLPAPLSVARQRVLASAAMAGKAEACA
jgi:DNA-binding response OmpR family regulator